MAKIIFTLDEVLKIITSNNLLPKQIVRAEVKNDSIHFSIRTEAFVLPFIPASLKYESFKDNIATFQLNLVSGHFNKALGFFGKSYESKLPEYIKLELPKVLVDIEKLFHAKNIKGICIIEVNQDSDKFTIITESKYKN